MKTQYTTKRSVKKIQQDFHTDVWDKVRKESICSCGDRMDADRIVMALNMIYAVEEMQSLCFNEVNKRNEKD